MKVIVLLVLVNVTRITTTNFTSLFLSQQGKNGFKAHACRLWHYIYMEPSRESLDEAVY